MNAVLQTLIMWWVVETINIALNLKFCFLSSLPTSYISGLDNSKVPRHPSFLLKIKITIFYISLHLFPSLPLSLSHFFFSRSLPLFLFLCLSLWPGPVKRVCAIEILVFYDIYGTLASMPALLLALVCSKRSSFSQSVSQSACMIILYMLFN